MLMFRVMRNISIVIAGLFAAAGLYLMIAAQLPDGAGGTALALGQKGGSAAGSAARKGSAVPVAGKALGTEPGPVVVELFTSQGCSSCPPADRYLGQLAEREDVIALSWHVDYWDYIGWKDKFASKESTARQRAYGRALGQRFIYTPEIVVDGRAHSSSPTQVSQFLERERAAPKLKVSISKAASGAHQVALPASGFKGKASVLLVFFDDKHVTKIARGENGGRDLANYNVVRDFRVIGTYTGAASTYPIEVAAAEAAGRGGCAVIVQQGAAGPVIGAAKMKLSGGS